MIYIGQKGKKLYVCIHIYTFRNTTTYFNLDSVPFYTYIAFLNAMQVGAIEVKRT